MKPLAIDLFCGLGGWAEGFIAEGYRVVGFDNDPRFAKVYPGGFVLQDVRTLDGRRFRDARCIVASPPCNRYSNVPDYFGTRKGGPDHSLVEAVWRIRRESGRPTLVENVQGARRWLGPAPHRGSQYLWGDVPLLPLLPNGQKDKAWFKTRPLRTPQALRAKIPLPLARAVARGFL
jgi:site-specific DNA-cytosine methylase